MRGFDINNHQHHNRNTSSVTLTKNCYHFEANFSSFSLVYNNCLQIMVCSCAMPAANNILFMRKGNRAFLLLRQIIDLLATDKSRYFLMLRHVQWLLIIFYCYWYYYCYYCCCRCGWWYLLLGFLVRPPFISSLSARSVITKCDSLFYYQVRQFFITKWGNFVTMCDRTRWPHRVIAVFQCPFFWLVRQVNEQGFLCRFSQKGTWRGLGSWAKAPFSCTILCLIDLKCRTFTILFFVFSLDCWAKCLLLEMLSSQDGLLYSNKQ